jgi:hypothetical protein
LLIKLRIYCLQYGWDLLNGHLHLLVKKHQTTFSMAL